jgi:hypothetical protein
MREGQSKDRTCYLRAILSRYGGIHTYYNTKTGLTRELHLYGHIDESWNSDPDPRFHNKPIRLLVHSTQEDIVSTLGVDHAFGSVAINAGVEPKPIEWQGEIVEDEPVKVEMAVRLDAFEAICRQAADAFDHGRILAARITLASESFPGVASDKLYIYLKNLDVSAAWSYAVEHFELID